MRRAIQLACITAWLNGRVMRARWETRPSLDIYDYTGSHGSNKTLVILWAGAFNHGPTFFERLIPLYRQVGDVCVVQYADLRFDEHDAAVEGYEYARKRRYAKLLLDGCSLGGIEALRTEEHVHLHAADYDPAIEKILQDVPLGGHHLLASMHPLLRWLLLWLVQRIHIGPLLNMLSPLIMPKIFKKVAASQTDGVDEDQWRRHMNAMWKLRFSVLIEQIAAIARQKPFTNVTGGPAVYLRSENDEVIDGGKASAAIRTLLGLTLLGEEIRVPGEHAMAVENHNKARAARVEALGRLGYTVV